MNMAQFHFLSQAFDYARDYGGWIAETDRGEVFWFDAACWTQTSVMLHPCLSGRSAKIGPWSDFVEEVPA